MIQPVTGRRIRPPRSAGGAGTELRPGTLEVETAAEHPVGRG